MKKIVLLLSATLLAIASGAQLKITNGAQWVMTGNALLVLDNMDFVNNGSFVAGKGTVRFSGNAQSLLGGTSVTDFYNLTVAKTPPQKLLLHTNTNVANGVSFVSGFLDLNNYVLDLGATGSLQNETEDSRMIGPLGGYAVAKKYINTTNFVNPGNLGANIAMYTDGDTLVLRRGHKVQSGTGLNGSVQRYYEAISATNTAINCDLAFYYFDAELNGLPEATLQLYKRADNGTNWTPYVKYSYSTVTNNVKSLTVPPFGRWTLSASANAPLPVTGLEFNARRITGKQVQLDWKTIQEISNKGFFIERRNEGEPQFTTLGFVPSMAPSGNSASPLTYQKPDDNTSAAKTYYRLRQEDLNGKTTYSPVRVVNGSAQLQVLLQAYPVPSSGPVTVVISGLQNEDKLLLFDAHAKLISQQRIENGKPVQLKILARGSYVVYPAGHKEAAQKIIIQ